MKEHIYVVSSGVIYRERNTLVIAGEEKVVLPVKRVASLHIYGNVSIASPTLRLLSENNIPAYFFSRNYTYHGAFIPAGWKENGRVLLAQSKAYFDKRIHLARFFVESVKNSMLLFLKNHYDAEIVKEIKGVRLEAASTVHELLGMESVLWKHFYSFLRDHLEFLEFERRVYRPPPDSGNAVISFVNSLLYGAVLNEIYNSALSPSIGYLHEVDEWRHALVLDVADVFKPVICAPVLLRADKVLGEEHFEKRGCAVYLTREGRSAVVELFERKMKSTVRIKRTGKTSSVRTAIRSFCVGLKDSLLRKKEIYPYTPW